MSNPQHDNSNRPIIIRNVKKVIHKHHGGSWKIAYADFVTAMMTFFLLMWLLSLLNKYQLQGIATYFKKPLKEVFHNQSVNVSNAKDSAVKTKSGPFTLKQTGFPSKTTNPGLNAPDGTSESTKTPTVKPVNTKLTIDSKEEMARFKEELEKKIDENPVLSQFKNQLDFVVTSDGLKIIIKDLKDKPMFSEGGLNFAAHSQTILSWLSSQLSNYANKIMIIGHTDSIPYPNFSDYGNWELSADRANATRRSLIESNVDPKQIIRVIGSADIIPLDKAVPSAPSNRRIEIILLNKNAEQHVLNE